MIKEINNYIWVSIQITIMHWQRFALSVCLEYDNCLWIFGGEGASPDNYLNEYGDFTYI